MKIIFIFYLLVSILLISCKTQIEDSMDNHISVKWEVFEQKSSPDQYSAKFILRNNTSETLTNKNWELHFNQIVANNLTNDKLSIKRISGDYFKLTPEKGFKNINPGDSVVLEYSMSGQFNRSSFQPLGLFLVLNDDQIIEVDYHSSFYPNGIPEEWKKNNTYKSPENLYQKYASNKSISDETGKIYSILPSVNKSTLGQKTLKLDTLKITYQATLISEANQLGSLISLLYNGSISLSEKKDGNITLGISKDINKEGYKLEIDDSSIKILGGSKTGVYYGIQTLIQLINTSSKGKESSISLPMGIIEDLPRFPYRGLMIDVARNFQSKESIMKMIDLMGYYKLNKLHFHLANDEGWRLDIKQIPELTSLGAFRGYTKDEQDNLYPAYGSGHDPHSINSYGNGFYTRQDYIEILQYAKKNHVEVIPEIVMPGHARAAIKAMEARYFALKDESKKEAEKYLLTDFDDSSKYNSVQNYTDNVICVGRESVYTFLNTVIKEIISIYEEAEAPLTMIHTGGDEVS